MLRYRTSKALDEVVSCYKCPLSADNGHGEGTA